MKSNFYEQLQLKIYWWLEKPIQSDSIALKNEQVAFGSSLGRRKNNQDRIVLYRVNFRETRRPNIVGMVLCDGMGGMLEGDDCANVAISSFLSSLVTSSFSDNLAEKLHTAIIDANHSVYEKYRGKGGATLSAVASDDTSLWTIANIGDSRIYSLSVDGKVKQLTMDDTLARQLDDLKMPALSHELMQLLQFVGMGDDITVSTTKVKMDEKIRCLLITSDGAHRIPEHLFSMVLNYADSHHDMVDRLITLSEWLGGKDNATVGVLPSTSKSLLGECEANSSGSLEIWSLSGKVELFTVNDASKQIYPLKSERSVQISGEGGQSREFNSKAKKISTKKKADKPNENKTSHREDKQPVRDETPLLNLQFDGENVE
jgi:PPM family protein phosphatase